MRSCEGHSRIDRIQLAARIAIELQMTLTWQFKHSFQTYTHRAGNCCLSSALWKQILRMFASNSGLHRPMRNLLRTNWLWRGLFHSIYNILAYNNHIFPASQMSNKKSLETPSSILPTKQTYGEQNPRHFATIGIFS